MKTIEHPYQKGDVVRVAGSGATALVIMTVEQFNGKVRAEQTRVVLLFKTGQTGQVHCDDFGSLTLVRESTYFGDLKAGRITTEDWMVM